MTGPFSVTVDNVHPATRQKAAHEVALIFKEPT